jgi:hypothetical protein
LDSIPHNILSRGTSDRRAPCFIHLFRARSRVRLGTLIELIYAALKWNTSQLRVNNLVRTIHRRGCCSSRLSRLRPRTLVSSRNERGGAYPAAVASCWFYGLDCRIWAGGQCALSFHHWSYFTEGEYPKLPTLVRHFISLAEVTIEYVQSML